MTPETIELLQRVKAAVLANPDHFDMDYWWRDDAFAVTLNENGQFEARNFDTVPRTPLLGLLDQCGTVACAAGWIVALSGEHVTPGEPIAHEAMRLIGVKDHEDPLPLFYVFQWPAGLRARYDHPARPEERAHAFAAAVDKWIAVDGDAEAFSAP